MGRFHLKHLALALASYMSAMSAFVLWRKADIQTETLPNLEAN
jgi:hypothetical protein